MFNKLIFLLILFCSLSFSQQYPLTTAEINVTAAGSVVSSEINFDENFLTLSEFYGLIAITLDVDSLYTELGTADIIYIKPSLKINGTWYEGDTLAFDRFDTADITADIIDTNIKLINVATYQDSLFIWRNDPGGTTEVFDYPVFSAFRVTTYYTADTSHFKIILRAGKH